MNRTFILLCLLAIIAACSDNDAIHPAKPMVAVPKESTLPADSLFDAFTISYQRKPFQLDNLQQGFDSLQIRFWQQQGLYGHRQLYVLKKTAGRWSATFFDLRLDSNYANGIGSSAFLHGPAPYHIKVRNQVTPVMGWQPFIDSLQALHIMTLPDSKEIAGMEVTSSHPTGYYMEVATKHHYRFYRYYSPHRFADKFWQADNLLGIEALIQEQLTR